MIQKMTSVAIQVTGVCDVKGNVMVSCEDDGARDVEAGSGLHYYT